MSSVKEKIATVQIYIHHVKGVNVDIALPRTKLQAFLLLKAFEVASQWLRENKV